MLSEDRNKLNRIENLKTKLFNKDYKTKIEHRDSFPHFQKKEVRDSWQKEEDDEMSLKDKFFLKTSMFKKFFIFSIIFFILALGYASYIFFAKGNTVSNNNIDISILSNTFTNGGEEYPLLLEIINRNNSQLELVDLVIQYPKSSEAVSPNDNEYIRLSLGNIPSGGIKNENIKMTLYGEQGSTVPLKISIEYRVEGSNAIFVKEKPFDISINSTPINLSIDAPTEVSSNQEMKLDVKATLNATKPVSKMMLKVDYPIGFQFLSSSPSPSLGNNIWNLGDLAPGAEKNISIVGKMLDVFDGEEKVFRVWSGSQSASDKSLIGTIFNSSEYKVAIKKSSIEAKLFVNGVYQREYAIDTKTSIQGQIQWRNNLETKINDLEIRAKISGNSVNRKTISAKQGFYNSSQDVIVWDKNSISKFSEINPSDSGTVSFALSSVPLFSASGGLVVAPSINIEVSITGRQAGVGDSSLLLSNSESKVIRIISDLGLSNKILYSSGAFENKGPLPPKAENSTTYTVVWSISNTSNNISKAQARSTLPPWVKFMGPFSPGGEDLIYNPSTKEIVWNIGTILKGTNITGASKEISFQIELIPSLSQVGTAPTLINDTILTGHDDFANVDVRVNKSSLDTRLLNDGDYSDSGRVIE